MDHYKWYQQNALGSAVGSARKNGAVREAMASLYWVSKSSYKDLTPIGDAVALDQWMHTRAEEIRNTPGYNPETRVIEELDEELDEVEAEGRKSDGEESDGDCPEKDDADYLEELICDAICSLEKAIKLLEGDN